MNRLFVESLLSIGAVETGDNPEADILFWKSGTIEPDQGPIEKKEDSMLDIESLDDAKALISTLEAKIAELTEEPDALPSDLPDVVAKRLDDLEAVIAKEREEKETLTRQVASLEDERVTEKYRKIAEELVIVGPVDETAPLLKEMGTLAPEATDKFLALLAPMSNAANFEKLLKEHGDASADGDVEDQVAAYAAEIRKADPALSQAQARAEVWRSHPELVALSREGGVR